MCRYIASNENRFYTALESEFGKVPSITASNRIPAVRLIARQAAEKLTRRDKTGTRSFLGLPTGMRRQTSFALRTNLAAWADPGTPPAYGPLFEAAMGGTPLLFAGSTVQSVENGGTRVRLGSAHGLIAGQAIAIAGEMRFVSAVVDGQTVDLCAPVSASAADAGPTVTYRLGRSLPSVSVFDYWSPTEAVQRIIHGAAVNEFRMSVNSDFHEFEFRGPARDVIDTMSFTDGEGGLSAWPEEPELDSFDYSIIPGHLGQVWIGSSPDRFFSLTEAQLKLDNGIETRRREFGMDGLCGVVSGQRAVSVDFEIYASDDDATRHLYLAARQKSPIGVTLQLGSQPGQLFGAYMKSVQLETPDFDDAETRLRWKFNGSRAQGTTDDELTVAFG
jgi:hypothetical protein